MKILGIETSCDETGVSIVSGEKTPGGFSFETISAALASQAALHAEYGGVYPNLAKREHIKNLPLMLEEAMEGISPDTINAIAVTSGPGLEPALWTGITFAEKLAAQWRKPLYAINHMEGHLISSLAQSGKIHDVKLPVLALLISGGHTEFILMRDWFQYKIIGQTQDDAVGEAFDKVARMLILPYPGGPHISRMAELGRTERYELLEESLKTPPKGHATHPAFSLPRPMIHDANCNMSFSGLKTSVLYALRDRGGIQKISMEGRAAVAREFEDAVSDVLIAKSLRAIEQTGAQTMVLGGGVAANAHLRKVIAEAVAKEFPEVDFLLPDTSITGDNAIMIAQAALARALSGKIEAATEPITAKGNLSLSAAV